MSSSVIVIGAGAAGLVAAAWSARSGADTTLIERTADGGRKILISGGGRCNFTNTGCVPERFVSANPHFARSALARYTPKHFVELLQRHRVSFEEREHAQLFCTDSAQDIIDLAGRVNAKAPGAQGMLISCGGLKTLQVGKTIEDKYGVPVVSSTPAAFWQAMRLVGETGSLSGFGRLFETVH